MMNNDAFFAFPFSLSIYVIDVIGSDVEEHIGR
jgi:hypothetical protein